MITIVVTPAELAAEDLRIEGDRYRHLFRARRTEVGERLRAVDGGGRARWGEIVTVTRSTALARLGAAAPAREPALALELLIAAPRPERAAWLVEKATELGASAIRFLAAERAPRAVGGPALVRLRRVAVAAVEQCHRARVPELSGPHAWRELEALLAPLAPRIALDPAGESAVPAPGAGRAGLLIGPEGGWTAAERDSLRALGCRFASLGERALRIETAAIAGTALLLRAETGMGEP